jgi:hypothetical protein
LIKNYVKGDIVKYYETPNKVIRAKIVSDYYTPNHVVHIFVLSEIPGGKKHRVRAPVLYKNGFVVKGVNNTERRIRTLEKRRKKELARLGIKQKIT